LTFNPAIFSRAHIWVPAERHPRNWAIGSLLLAILLGSLVLMMIMMVIMMVVMMIMMMMVAMMIMMVMMVYLLLVSSLGDARFDFDDCLPSFLLGVNPM